MIENFWVVGVHDKPPWLTRSWWHMKDGDIVNYLGIFFGVNLSMCKKSNIRNYMGYLNIILCHFGSLLLFIFSIWRNC